MKAVVLAHPRKIFIKRQGRLGLVVRGSGLFKLIINSIVAFDLELVAPKLLVRVSALLYLSMCTLSSHLD